MICEKHNSSGNAISLPISKKRIRQKVIGNYQNYILLLPAFVYVLLFSYYPMYGVQIAFKNFRTSLGIMGSEWVGFEHFMRFLSFRDFQKIVKNTLSISLYVLATFPISVVFALMINEIINRKYKKTVQMITYIPHFLSTVVICGMISLFFNRSSGFVNSFIETMGLERIDFLTRPEWFRHIYVWSGVWSSMGWGTIIYLAALSNVSPDLVDAAKIDGAGRLKIVRHINVPSILPTIIIMLILSTGGILSVGFEKIYLLQNPLNLETSRVISTYVYEIGLLGGQYSYSAAIGLFNNLVNITLLIMVNLVAKRISEVSLW